MTITNTDLETDAFLAHYGVKGMRWGASKAASSGGGSGSKSSKSAGNKGGGRTAAKPDNSARNAKIKKGVKIGAGVLAVAGAAAAITVMSKNGSTPAKSTRPDPTKSSTDALFGKASASNFGLGSAGRSNGGSSASSKSGGSKPAQAANRGKKATEAWPGQTAYRKSIKDLLDDMGEANKEQDAWMRSQGLGSVVNNDRRT